LSKKDTDITIGHISRTFLAITYGTQVEGICRFSVANPDPGSSALLTPGSVMEKNTDSGSGINISNHFFESLETVFWVKNA
jgi:hypothetical protein